MLILNPERAQAQLDELDEQRVRAEARYSEVLAALVNQRDRADAAEAALNAARTELNRLHASEYPGGWTEELNGQIRARHEAEAEVKMLKAALAQDNKDLRERDMLREAMKGAAVIAQQAGSEINRLRTKIEALQVENEAVKAANRDCVVHFDAVREDLARTESERNTLRTQNKESVAIWNEHVRDPSK